MSLDPILWALKDAPVADSLERLVLVALAERAARADGCTAFPSRDTLAATVLADPKTVQRVLKRLEGRGLIGKGDQSAARYLRADRRPVVYDLLIPYSWFPNPDRMNAERAQAGLPPLTPADRPDIAPPPERARRSDAGKPRSKRSTARGDSESPRDGGTDSPARGDCESRTGGLEAPRTSPSDTPRESTPSSEASADHSASAAPLVDPQTEGGGGEDAPQQDEDSAAAAFVDSLPYAGRRPDRVRRARMISLVTAAFAAGWSESALRIQLTSETETAKSLAAVYAHRLDPAVLPAAPQMPQETDAAPRPPADRPRCRECGARIRLVGQALHDGLCRLCREDPAAA